jgi:putative transposase
VCNLITPENYYCRHLPHFQPLGATYFVTFRLAGSLAAASIEKWVHEKAELEKAILRARTDEQRAKMMELYRVKHFGVLDCMLNRSRTGPLWLRQPEIAQIVVEAIEFRDGTMFDLYAYCIMPNHVHLVFKLPEEVKRCKPNAGGGQYVESSCLLSRPVTDIIGSLKKHTALEANRKLGRHGAFWKSESHDHVVRDGEELERILWYVILNPVKARLVKSWADWKWTYCKPGLLW